MGNEQEKDSRSAYQEPIACVRGLGLRRLRDSRELEDTPAVRGMIREVRYMVKYDEV